MSARKLARALERLAQPQAMLAPAGAQGYGLYPTPDRRRRPVLRLSQMEVRELSSSGAIDPAGDGFVLSAAGRAKLKREGADDDVAYLAQHAPIGTRAVANNDGAVRTVRAIDSAYALKRLAALRDANGASWLSVEELAAAARLQSDWLLGQVGLVRGSDWSAPPQSGSARGAGNAQEAALERRCDARQRSTDALNALAPQLRRVVEQVCLREEGLEALERREGWPARSGKIALKLGLAQLAASQVYRRA